MPRTISFWFEYASPYSMITALRLFHAISQKAAPAAASRGLPSCEVPSLDGVRVVYRPIFLGAVFKAVGQQFLPNIQVPVKGSYMFHDVSRALTLLGCQGFPTAQPKGWPRNTALAGRMTWLLAQGPEYISSLDKDQEQRGVVSSELEASQTKVLSEFVWRVYEAEFIANEDIGDREVMSRLWDRFVVGESKANGDQVPDGKRAVELASAQAVKDGFRANGDAAVEEGVFGAPTFTTEDGDMYWGNDRLVEAVHHHEVCQKDGAFTGFCAKRRGANL
ncbi:thioredoxin-like protein [Martensiomyces pterosporus]|nr:thioredoxin-like protein [Martensiomyces pterosporus]